MIITADAAQYHLACAKRIYGVAAIEQAIRMARRYDEYTVTHNRQLLAQWPQDSGGNLIHIDAGRFTSPYDCDLCNNERIKRMTPAKRKIK